MKLKEYKIQIIILLAFTLITSIFLLLYFEIPRINYKYDSELDCYIVDSAYGDAKSYYIEAEIKGKPVKIIGEKAFYKHKNLENLEFENINNIKQIKRLAFYECTNLKQFDLTKTDEIERGAFSFCLSLEKVDINAKDIGGSAFYGCNNLKEIKLSKNVRLIGSYAFCQTAIEEITLPYEINNVFNNVFDDCNNLKVIYCYKDLKDNLYLNTLKIVKYLD